MRAVVAPGDGTISVRERPDPRPGTGQVVVKIGSAGLNRADLLQRRGLYPAPPGSPPDIPGLEFAGEVVELGEDVSTLAVGSRVFGIAGGGCQAEQLVVHADHCALIPEGLETIDAGAVPEVFVTAHDAMRTRAHLTDGEHVLVHAVGSGVGTAVVQLAKAWGCSVTGTARSPEKLRRAESLGIDTAVLARSPLEPAALADAITSQAEQPDVVVDLVGGPYVVADILAAAPQGRIVVVGTLAGGSADLPLHLIMAKRLEIHGTVLRARSVAHKADAMQRFAGEVVPMLATGAVAPIIDAVFPLDDAAAAYELLESDTTFGKVLLRTA
jgi:NADPH:quinone reductase